LQSDSPMEPIYHDRLDEGLAAKAGKARTGILLWLLGVPLPIILLIWAIKGCV